MARRRRLTPAQPDYLGGMHPAPEAPARPFDPAGAPPIARVAAEASASSALQEVAQELAAARSEGRLVLRLPLEAVETGYLVRDRIETDEAGLAALVESIRHHGQRSPIEVAELAPGRYGLISGWRRMAALGRLAAERGESGTVLALLRRPESAGAAYVAMVEENEVRLGLSYYERARIVAKSVDAGVFETEQLALRTLFASASRARRSKIGSFVTICRQLDGALGFPAALPERLGLQLARALDADPDAGARIARDLAAAAPADAAAEQALLAAFLRGGAKGRAGTAGAGGAPATGPAPQSGRDPGPGPDRGEEIRPGVFLHVGGTRRRPVLTLSGPRLDPELRNRLLAWLRKT